MNTKIKDFKTKMRGKNIAVLGIGASNTPLIKYLSKFNSNITAFDKRTNEELQKAMIELEGLPINYSLGENYLSKLKGFDVIFKTPGVRCDIPELVEEQGNGAEITSEMEVFLELCPAQIFGITGSDGKTTTTTITYNLLKQHGFNCWLGGNIGTPLLDQVENIKETDKVVLELSSFQLHTAKVSPDVAVVTNITPNHLDMHKSMEEYIEAKKNIFKYQNSGKQKLVINYDNEITRSFSGEAKGQVVFFSVKEELPEGMFLRGNKIIYKACGVERQIMDADEIFIPGMHNVENYLAAVAAVIDQVDLVDIHNVAKDFRGVENRIEFVKEVDGVKFYNDSIATSPTRTMAALRSFKQKIILIAGGSDKHLPYDPVAETIWNKAKCVVLLGKTAPKIEKAIEDYASANGKDMGEIQIINSTTFDDAVKVAFGKAVPGDVVLLSPASASYDMFKNFEERGRRFKTLVGELAR